MVMINHLKIGMILQVEELYPSDWRVNTSHVNTHGTRMHWNFDFPTLKAIPKGWPTSSNPIGKFWAYANFRQGIFVLKFRTTNGRFVWDPQRSPTGLGILSVVGISKALQLMCPVQCSKSISHGIHGTGIFTYIWILWDVNFLQLVWVILGISFKRYFLFQGSHFQLRISQCTRWAPTSYNPYSRSIVISPQLPSYKSIYMGYNSIYH